jgi:hypothetical protein
MTDYANAPAPQGALFDNAPAQTTYPMHTPKTSADYTPAVAVWPGGATQRCNVKRALVVDAAEAREQLQHGAVCVYVRTQDDAEAVRGTSGVNG